MKGKGNCDYCLYYNYDEYFNYYICEMNLDEDEMARFIKGNFNSCPYFQIDDEYKIVRKQM